MDYGYISIIVLLMLIFIGYFVYSQRSIKSLQKDSQSITLEKPVRLKEGNEPSLTDFERFGITFLATENGDSLMECRELSKFPSRTIDLDTTSSGYASKIHLISDLVKAGGGAKGRNIELCFKADIQSQLNSGAAELMKTKKGEVLADAVRDNRIIGKGRVIEGGRLKQMGSAGFQLLSVAVAQSHLSDIANELSGISSSLDRVIEKLDINDKKMIKGATSYLESIYRDIVEGKDISDVRKQEFETCIRDTHEYFEGIVEEIELSIKAISEYSSDETFGTGNTYEALRRHVNKLNGSIEKCELYFKLSLISKMVRLQLDPIQAHFSVERIDYNRLNELWDSYSDVSNSKVKNEIKASFNAKDTLELRIDSLSKTISEQVLKVKHVALQSEMLSIRLDSGLNNLIDDNEYKMALSYDEEGNLAKAAMVGG